MQSFTPKFEKFLCCFPDSANLSQLHLFLLYNLCSDFLYSHLTASTAKHELTTSSQLTNIGRKFFIIMSLKFYFLHFFLFSLALSLLSHRMSFFHSLLYAIRRCSLDVVPSCACFGNLTILHIAFFRLTDEIRWEKNWEKMNVKSRNLLTFSSSTLELRFITFFFAIFESQHVEC